MNRKFWFYEKQWKSIDHSMYYNWLFLTLYLFPPKKRNGEWSSKTVLNNFFFNFHPKKQYGWLHHKFYKSNIRLFVKDPFKRICCKNGYFSIFLWIFTWRSKEENKSFKYFLYGQKMFYENLYRIKSSRDMDKDPFSQRIRIPITG